MNFFEINPELKPYNASWFEEEFTWRTRKFFLKAGLSVVWGGGGTHAEKLCGIIHWQGKHSEPKMARGNEASASMSSQAKLCRISGWRFCCRVHGGRSLEPPWAQYVSDSFIPNLPHSTNCAVGIFTIQHCILPAFSGWYLWLGVSSSSIVLRQKSKCSLYKLMRDQFNTRKNVFDDLSVERNWDCAWYTSSLGRWGSRITDAGLIRISLARCCPNLKSISMWGVTSITDDGVVHLVCSSSLPFSKLATVSATVQ